MEKKIMVVFLSFILILVFTGAGMAGDKGNKRRGKHLYRKVYKECHGESAMPVSPDSKTQAQWKRVFDKGKFEVFGCENKWEAMTEKDSRDIFTYLHGHAFDSPSPAKCK